MVSVLKNAALRVGRFGPIKNLLEFGRNVTSDYKAVGVDVFQQAKDRPLKATAYGSLLSFLFYAYKTNPDDTSFREQLVKSYAEMGLVHPDVRNPAAYQHVVLLNQLDSQRVLKKLSLGVVSFVFQGDYDSKCGHYYSQCTYLQPSYLSYFNRIVDIGFLGQWRVLQSKLVDYDVNPVEWQENKKDG